MCYIDFMTTLLLIRGLPGSGKSTLAETFKSRGYVHTEADMYFVNDAGTYVFDPSKLKNAHAWCQRVTEQSLMAGRNVVVSNTFTQMWELDAYVQIARRTNASLQIMEATGNFQNVHGVPDAAIQRMKDRWEPLSEELSTLMMAPR